MSYETLKMSLQQKHNKYDYIISLFFKYTISGSDTTPSLIEPEEEQNVPDLSPVLDYIKSSNKKNNFFVLSNEQDGKYKLAKNYGAERMIASLKNEDSKLLQICAADYASEDNTSTDKLLNTVFKEQKLLSDTLFQAKRIKYCLHVMRAYIDKEELHPVNFDFALCMTQDAITERHIKDFNFWQESMDPKKLESEKLVAKRLVTQRSVTKEDIEKIALSLQSQRSYLTGMSDIFQEILDDIADLIPILQQWIKTDRSTTSLAWGLFKHAQHEEKQSIHENLTTYL